MSRWPAAVVLLAVLLSTTATAAPDFAAVDIQRYEPPKAAPEFALPNLEGRQVRLSEFKGKVVLLFYWATW